MKYKKSSKDKDAFQIVSYKFPIGESHITGIIKKDETGNIFYARIKIIMAKGLPKC